VVAAEGGREGEAALAGAVDAVDTRRNRDGSFVGLDHFDDGRVANLRLLAERRWVAWPRERGGPAARLSGS
jgi:hypothetical protein